MARTVHDAAIMLSVMAGYDLRDLTSMPLPVPDFEATIGGDVNGLRVGIPREYRIGGRRDRSTAARSGMAARRRAEIVEVSLPHTRYALATYYIIAPAEASSNLARYDGVRFGRRVEGATLDEMYQNTAAKGLAPRCGGAS